MHQNVIFKEYDIRGVVGKEFDMEFPYLLGRAYCTYMKNKKGITNPTITLGYDARLSSVEIKNALTRGLTESGAKVVHIGLVTSPISYFTTFTWPDIQGAIMITGSHNPPDYNGFKISVGKATIFGEEIQELRKIIEKKDFLNLVGAEETRDVFPTYLERYKSEFKNLAGLKVVLDCGNGAAGCIIKKLFEVCGLKPTILFEQPDGRFPNHHPDPTVEKNLVDLSKQVIAEGAVVGIGFDGDADRIGLVDHTGKMIYGDELMILINRAVLEANPGAKIIGDVKCSDRMFLDVANRGGVPIMWKTGHSLVKEKIKEEKAPFGGEMSGHVFFADRNYGYDDAMYAALRVCEILATTKKTIPQLLEGIPAAFNTPEIRIDTTEEKKHLIVTKLKEKFAKDTADYKVDFTDGVRVSFADGWALARASNTQPVLVLRFESWTELGLKNIRAQFESVVEKYI
jgi:phosphomannomutase